MPQLTPAGQQAVADIAQRTGFSTEAVTALLYAVSAGGGSMAQFSHPEFGGSGQWMRGGMTMIGDMFNSGLKSRVVAACDELSALLGNDSGLFVPVSAPGSQGYGVQGVGGGVANWWPSELGWPNSTGAQNDVRYAYFAQSHRLAIEQGGRLTVYDTLDHQIGGFGQQQGSGSSLSFTSQYGSIDVSRLPIVSGDSVHQQHYAPPPPLPPVTDAPGGDVFAAIEKLAELHTKGILTENEFNTKKAELLRRV